MNIVWAKLRHDVLLNQTWVNFRRSLHPTKLWDQCVYFVVLPTASTHYTLITRVQCTRMFVDRYCLRGVDAKSNMLVAMCCDLLMQYSRYQRTSPCYEGIISIGTVSQANPETISDARPTPSRSWNQELFRIHYICVWIFMVVWNCKYWCIYSVSQLLARVWLRQHWRCE